MYVGKPVVFYTESVVLSKVTDLVEQSEQGASFCAHARPACRALNALVLAGLCSEHSVYYRLYISRLPGDKFNAVLSLHQHELDLLRESI